MKQAFRADHAVPISKAVRAGDFVFTSAYGPWLFDPKNLTYDEAGNVLDDGTGNGDMSFEEQVHRTFGFIKDLVDRIETVTEDDLTAAIAGLVEHEHLVAEGAGAAAVAALVGRRAEARGRRVAAIVSGSNIDRARLAALL